MTGCAATMRFRGLQTVSSGTAMAPAQRIPAYRNAEGIIKRLIGAVPAVTGIDYYHSNRDVRESGLLAI